MPSRLAPRDFTRHTHTRWAVGSSSIATYNALLKTFAKTIKKIVRTRYVCYISTTTDSSTDTTALFIFLPYTFDVHTFQYVTHYWTLSKSGST